MLNEVATLACPLTSVSGVAALHTLSAYDIQHNTVSGKAQKAKLVLGIDRFVALRTSNAVALAEVVQHAGAAKRVATSRSRWIDEPGRADGATENADIVLSALLEVAHLTEAE